MDKKSSEVCAEVDVILPAVRALDNISVGDDVFNIQYFPQSLEMALATISNPVSFSDFKGFQSNFGTEVELTSVLEAAIDQGQDYIWSLYAYRSVSKAIPEVVIETPEGARPEDEAEIAMRRAEINRKIVDILRGGMSQMKELKAYVTNVVGIFHRCISHLAQSTSAESAAAEGLYLLLIRLLDLLIKLDNLKDMKASVLNDFARYKRAIGSKMSSENVEEITLLQSFLSSFDVKKSKNFIFSTLRDEVKRVRGHEEILGDVLDHCMHFLDKELYLHAEEKFRLIRVLPYLLLLIDGNDDEPKSYNVFTGKKYKSLSQVQKYIKNHPVVPVCGDMSLTLGYVLELTRHFDRDTMAAAWGLSVDNGNASRNATAADQKLAAEHSLLTHWKSIRQTHADMVVRLTATLNRLRVYKFDKVYSDVSMELAKDAYDVTLGAFRAIADWNTKLFEMVSWKYTHPVSSSLLEALGVAGTVGEGLEYEQVIRYNLSKEEKCVIVDVVSLIKSLSSQLTEAESVLSPLIRYHIHHSIQQLVQGDLIPILHRVDKRNKSNQLSVLLAIRNLAADWTNKVDPGENYKQYSRKQGSVAAVHNPRVVSATHTQLHLLRMFIYSVYDDSSAMRQRNGLLGKADLEKDDVKLLESFYLQSYFFPYMLAFTDTVRYVSDLSDLWYKEFYLELTKCIQFPIEMSIPWILTEQLLVSKGGDQSIPLVENVLYTIDIYNDAANKALNVLCQQYLYDEIEAEANLVLDQIIFLLSDEVYLYAKETVSSNQIDQPLRKKLEEIKGEVHLQVAKRRLFLPVCQRNVQLLGRSINLNFLIGQHINGKFQKDLEIAIKKFESADVRGLPELCTMLQILRHTHHVLGSLMELDPFDAMLSEVDESVAPTTSSNGRIFTHISRSICCDLIPNFCYNIYTQRFIKAPFPLKPIEYEKAPKTASVHALFGDNQFKAHEMALRLSKYFFGKIHMECLFQLAGHCDVALLINYLLESLRLKLDDIVAYMDALRGGIPPCKAPQYKYKTGGVYAYYLGKLRAVLEYDDLKPEVFQGYREIGNIIAFVKDLSELLDVHEQLKFVTAAPFLGLSPDAVEVPIPTAAPLGAVLQRLSESLVTTIDQVGTANTTSSKHQQQSTSNQSTLQQLQSASAHHRVYNSALTIAQLPELAGKMVSSLSSVLQTKSLLSYFMSKMDEAFFQFNLTSEWGLQCSSEGAVVLDAGNSFHHLFSALNFLFCVVENQADFSDGQNPDSNEEQDIIIPDDDEFGHGFAIAGILFMHLLGQRPVFEMADFSYFVLNVYNHDKRVVVNDGSVGDVDSDLIAETNRFVSNAFAQRSVHLELFSYFEMQIPRHKSTNTSIQGQSTQSLLASGVASNIVKLHPPPEDV